VRLYRARRGRFRRFPAAKLVGLRRGEGGELIGTGGWPWGGRTAEIRPAKVRPRGRERAERERVGGEERERGFPKMETLANKNAHKWKLSKNALATSVDYNSSIRTPIFAYFMSTNSVRRDLQLS
jgi:hypothetical protein